METPYTEPWLSDNAEERIVLECLLSFAKNHATGFGGKRIRRFAKTGTPQPYVEALKKIGVLGLSDVHDDSYVFYPHKAMEYFSGKGKNPEKILRKFYPSIDLKGPLAAYDGARKGKP